MQSRDVDTPSIDDWGSCGQACGKTSAGILVHGILQQCVEVALPNWGTMLPPNNRGGAGNVDSIGIQRMRIQKKAWRSKSFLSDGPKKLRCLLLCWLAIAVESLMFTLDHLDSGTKGLFDAVLDGTPLLSVDCGMVSRIC